MTCVYDAVFHLFKRNGVKIPRDRKIQKQCSILCHPYNESGKEINATFQAKILCSMLRRLASLSPFSRNAFVFVHPPKKNEDGHCLALHENLGEPERYCAFEDNWRTIYHRATGFKFNTRDWTTSSINGLAVKPFRFSYFITLEGYSIWVPPRMALKALSGKPFEHKYNYHPLWEDLI